MALYSPPGEGASIRRGERERERERDSDKRRRKKGGCGGAARPSLSSHLKTRDRKTNMCQVWMFSCLPGKANICEL